MKITPEKIKQEREAFDANPAEYLRTRPVRVNVWEAIGLLLLAFILGAVLL